ncbi:MULTISPECIES: hypothetical protein [unclassified Microbacterium]|nr:MULTISPECIES: hypothetical protein [unclassified Microbacterium]MCR2802105.1 hypothetical protein [Microbacterium sp. zg.Y818]MCR2826398.1 hypothetical protein [Microbacterium sp. zg.Y909]WIM22653.1 hypothetical protein QNO21_01045 [Microbacterium sp. zg-Y818]
MARETARSSGWWGKFVALFLGVPPIAVQAADEDTDDEPGPFAPRSQR